MNSRWIKSRSDATHPVLLDTGPTIATICRTDELVALTGLGVILKEIGYPPRIYVPVHDVRVSLRAAPRVTHCPFKGDANYFHVEVRGEMLEHAAWCYNTPLDHLTRMAGLIAFDERFKTAIG